MRLRRTMIMSVLAAVLAAVAAPGLAAEPGTAPPPRKSEPIYGFSMMTPQERDEYRARMRNARSAAERQAIRDEHRKQMQARAKERGITLPDRARGPGAGPGTGRGPGYGPGAGKGPGGGPGDRPGAWTGPGFGPGPCGEFPPGQDPRGARAGGGPGARYGPPAGRETPPC